MFHLWRFRLMALTFNMHLFTAPNAFLLFGYLQPGRACVTSALQGEVESVMRKRLRRECSGREPFRLLSFGWLISRNPGTGLTQNAVDVGSSPARAAIRLPLEMAASSGEAGKASVRFSFLLTSLLSLQFQSPPLPRVSFHIREQISIAYGYKTWSGKEENPYFEGKEPTMGSANRLWSAWQDPDCFSSPAPRSDRSRAAALKALAPSSRLGFGVTPGGPRNPHLRPKTGGWEYAGLFWRLDDLT